jgi:hypothetical protein
MMRMPGLPAIPASEGMDIDANGVVSGLSWFSELFNQTIFEIQINSSLK